MTTWVEILMWAGGILLTILVNAIVVGYWAGTLKTKQEGLDNQLNDLSGKMDEMTRTCSTRMGEVGKELKRVEIKYAAATGDSSNGG